MIPASQPHIEIRERDYRLTLITPPLDTDGKTRLEPMSLADAKTLLGVTLSSDDFLISRIIARGRHDLEQKTGFRILTQTWDYSIEQFPYADRIEFPIRPLQAVTSLKFTDATGAINTVDPATYTVNLEDGGSPQLVLKLNQFWPTNLLQQGFNVTARVEVGFSDTAEGLPEWVGEALGYFIQRAYDLIQIARSREPGTSPRTYAHQQLYDAIIREHRFE